MKRRVRTVCECCSGTGLYSGMCEGKGKAVICLSCDGSGCAVFVYTPFKRRRGRRDIKTVNHSAGRCLIGPVGAIGKAMTYAQFLKDRRFKKVPR